jgi:integrase/recombinase XerD
VWMMRERAVLSDPFIGINLPRSTYRLPRVLGVADLEKVLHRPRVHTRLGLRDRALLETLYSTGIRRTELLRLRLHDIDWHKELVSIRMGKGRKDRVIPIGERALAWMDRYLWKVRRSFVVQEETSEVFLTRSGKPFTPNHLSGLVRKYIEKALPGRSGACHTFRHSMATLMLEGGADIRFIQQMLGHSKLSSTQIYTHVSVQALKDVHSRTHPAARLLAAARQEIEQEPPEPK